jgi:hypothetical protein
MFTQAQKRFERLRLRRRDCGHQFQPWFWALSMGTECNPALLPDLAPSTDGPWRNAMVHAATRANAQPMRKNHPNPIKQK